MIGRFMVWQLIQNIWDMIMCVMLLSTFVPSMTSIGCLTSQSEAFMLP